MNHIFRSQKFLICFCSYSNNRFVDKFCHLENLLGTYNFPLHCCCLQLYQTLVQCRSVSVRQTLASSLHEVARVLGGGAVVEEELVPVFEEFIQVHRGGWDMHYIVS